MTSPTPQRLPKATLAPARPIPIRAVPRAAIDALVARLVASGAVEHPIPANEAY